MVSGGRGCDLGLGFRGSREGESEEGRSTAQGGLQVDAGREGGARDGAAGGAPRRHGAQGEDCGDRTMSNLRKPPGLFLFYFFN